MDAKKILEDNYKAENESFVYYLKEKSLFNKDAFRKLYESINSLAESEVEISRTAQQINAVYGYILKYFLYNFDTEDPYKITNLPDNYNKMLGYLDKAVEYYFSTRI